MTIESIEILEVILQHEIDFYEDSENLDKKWLKKLYKCQKELEEQKLGKI